MGNEAPRSSEERAKRTRARLQSIGDIPTLPAVLVQVWDLTTRDNTSAADLGRVIGADPGLTGALLRLANSAYFGFPRKVATVTQAVVILGFDTVKSLAMGASVFRALRPESGRIDPAAFFHHSLVTAMAARFVMERRHPGRAAAAFSGGILHDLGKLVMVEFLSEAEARIRARIDAGEEPEAAEREELGLSHAEIGGWFAGAWNFPDELAAAVAWHHRPGQAPDHRDHVAAVHLGDVLAHRAGANGSGRPVPPEPDAAALAETGLDDTDLEALLERVRATEVGVGTARATLGG